MKMAKAKAQQNDTIAPGEPTEFPLDVNGRFFTVFKDSYLLYLACEIKVLKGIVVDFKILSRAPDQQCTAVGAATSEIWPASREQTQESVYPGVTIEKTT